MQQTSITWPRSVSTSQNRTQFSGAALEAILTKYTLLTLAQLKQMWNISGRYYHSFEHCEKMLALASEMRDQIEAHGCSYDALVLAILFHDIIYVPGAKYNELLSAKFFDSAKRRDIDWAWDGVVYTAICETEYGDRHVGPSVEKSLPTYWLQQIDLHELIHGTREQQLVNFFAVYNEYSGLCNHDKALFESKQNEFLVRLAEKFGFNYEPITWDEIGEYIRRED